MEIESIFSKNGEFIGNRIKNLEYFGARNNKDYFYVNLQITLRCNYNCYYCSDLHNNKISDIEYNYNNFKFLFETIRKYTNKSIYLWIYGGEPFLYSYFNNFVSNISDLLESGDKAELISNFSLPYDIYLNFAKKYYQKNFIISCSYHNTQEKDFISFLKKVLMFESYGMLNCVSMMINSKKEFVNEYDMGYCIRNRFNYSPLISPSINGEPPEKFGSDPLYELKYIDKEKIDFYKNYSYEFSDILYYKLINNNTPFFISKYKMWLNKLNCFYNMKCNIGKERIVMNHDGLFYNCFNEIYVKNRKKNIIFDINSFNKDFIIDYFKNLSPITCIYNKCLFDFEHLKFLKNNYKYEKNGR